MTKVSRKPLPKDFGNYINNIWSAFTLLNTKADIRLLFKDLLTHTEYKMLAKRLAIARRLLDKDRYADIREALSVTDSTISVVSNVLVERGEGYRKAHTKLSELEKEFYEKAQEKDGRMSNPFNYKARRKTVLGAVVKASLHKMDEKIIKAARTKSAKEKFDD